MPESPTGDALAASASPDRPGEAEGEVARLRRELDAARENAAVCRMILESATDYAIITLDQGGRVTGWNAGARNLFGWEDTEALGLDNRLLFTPEDRECQQPELEMARALTRGRAENERWHLRKDGQRFWGSGLLLPLQGAPAGGFLKIMLDRTERREGEERQGVLLRELAHRVKNTLALILAMARQTGLSAADLAGFLDAFEGRLQALSAVHDLVSEAGWRSTSLPDLARTALAPHDEPGGGRRVTINVEELPINPAAAQNLVLALHELATNAAKHGALSAPGGTVALEGRVATAGDDGPELVLAWREAGGPPATPPREPGFGTTLLEQVVAYQHNGRVTFDWRPEGLACTLRLPLAEIAGSEVEVG